jgi:hypothetical protein
MKAEALQKMSRSRRPRPADGCPSWTLKNWSELSEFNGNGLIVSNLSTARNLYNIHLVPVQTPLGEVNWEPTEIPCMRAGRELRIAPVFSDLSLQNQGKKQRICQVVSELFNRKLADNQERFDALSLNIQCEDEDNMRYAIQAPIVHVPGAPIQIGRLVRRRLSGLEVNATAKVVTEHPGRTLAVPSP